MSSHYHPLIQCDDLIDITEVDRRIASGAAALNVFKQALESAQTEMDKRFKAGEDIRNLVYGRACVIDQIIIRAWALFDWPAEQYISLVAVGGYGRGELHPQSDVDILILTRDIDPKTIETSISQFLTLLWDISLEIGSSVRSIEDCYLEAQFDITIATNLVESRPLTGDPVIHQQMYERVTSEGAWTDKEFFKAKLKEQTERHQKTNNTAYNLEPNLKNSPGGLRDIQTIGWIARRHFGTTYLHDLIDRGFVTETELDTLNKGELYLWSVRYALHMLCKRREDRLLFDHQRTLADFFGYKNQPGALAVEQFMSKYYRVAMTMSGFNDMLLQHFDEAILHIDDQQTILPINSRFQIRNNYLEVTQDDVFEHHPAALLEAFVLIAQRDDIEGVRASTIRLIRDSRELIDDAFRSNSQNTDLFMALMKSENGVSTELKRMNRYGILGRYLPEFGRIVGQMQHDLFHIYTVDAHTLKVVQKMRQFRHQDHKEQFPVAFRIVNELPKIELLYIAGLYHDIAKGRGGDHSKLGAVDAMEFCERHNMSKWDSKLVSWLVSKHLLMSITAQRKDISDPEVIHNFATEVQDIVHLNYLYVLTVADINATNHSLWNSWRATLLRQLYSETKRVLTLGLENPVNKEEQIEQVQQEAMSILLQSNQCEADIQTFWATLGEEYFLRELAKNIAWHTQSILEHQNQERPLVLIQKTSFRTFEGATEIFIYNKDIPNLFSATVATLDQLNLNIQDARIIVTEDGRTLNTYTVLNDDNQDLPENGEQLNEIQQTLINALDDPDDFPEIIQKRVPRQMKLFAMPTRVNLSNDASAQHTVMEVRTPDRPGLLARIGRIFASLNIYIHKAKIASMGESVEDFFFITDQEGLPISNPELCEELQKRVCEELDEHIQDE